MKINDTVNAKYHAVLRPVTPVNSVSGCCSNLPDKLDASQHYSTLTQEQINWLNYFKVMN